MASELGEAKRGETIIWIYYVRTKSVFTKMKNKYIFTAFIFTMFYIFSPAIFPLQWHECMGTSRDQRPIC